MSEEVQRLCIGCMHYGPRTARTWAPVESTCLHPWNLSPVDGEPVRRALELRYDSMECGFNGRWHEPGISPVLALQRANHAVMMARKAAGWSPIPQAGAIVVYRP